MASAPPSFARGRTATGDWWRKATTKTRRMWRTQDEQTSVAGRGGVQPYYALVQVLSIIYLAGTSGAKKIAPVSYSALCETD